MCLTWILITNVLLSRATSASRRAGRRRHRRSRPRCSDQSFSWQHIRGGSPSPCHTSKIPITISGADQRTQSLSTPQIRESTYDNTAGRRQWKHQDGLPPIFASFLSLKKCAIVFSASVCDTITLFSFFSVNIFFLTLSLHA